MCEHSPDTGSKKAVMKKPYKQAYIVMTMLGISFCSQASEIERDNEHYIANPVALVVLLLLIFLTEKKGRKPLFITLCILSIISSSTPLIYELEGLKIDDCAQSALRGATIALTALVMCEYCEPSVRYVYLIINSTVLKVSYWVTLESAKMYDGFGEHLLYFKILLGFVCLGSVFTWPESPYWLASRKRFKESTASFLSVRSKGAADELQALTDTKLRRGSLKMIYTPLLLALPLLIIFSTNVYDLEKDFLLDFVQRGNGRIFLYIIMNILSTILAVFVSLKVCRRKLIVYYSLWSIACFVLTYLWETYLDVYVSDDVGYYLNMITYVSFYIVVFFGSSTFYLSAVVEVVPRRQVCLFTLYTGVPYLMLGFAYDVFGINLDLNVYSTILYVAVSSVVVYFLLPEANGKTLIEIEQEYLPKVQDV